MLLGYFKFQLIFSIILSCVNQKIFKHKTAIYYRITIIIILFSLIALHNNNKADPRRAEQACSSLAIENEELMCKSILTNTCSMGTVRLK